MNFINQLKQRWENSNSLLCVGLDPDLSRFPDILKRSPKPIFEFNKAIIDATHDLVCAYKPQIAYFAAVSAEDQLQATIDYIHQNYPDIPVILDAKRGDIGSTAAMYALESFERYAADAVTLNPYMGYDSAQPFLSYADKGCVFLCRTSNAGAADYQDLLVDGKPLYMRVARRISEQWNGNHNCLLVVGATWPEQMADLRVVVGDMPFLVPGIGAQGGDVGAIMQAGLTSNKQGLLINSSRGILYAGGGSDFAEQSRKQALLLRDEINQFR